MEQVEWLVEFKGGTYSKEEVDGFIEGLKNQIGDLKFAMGTYIGMYSATDVSKTQTTIVTGFIPIFVMISVATNTNYSSRWGCYEISGTASYPFGFGLPYKLRGLEILTVAENGFIVANESNSNGSIKLNQSNIINNYLAFG